MTQERKMELLQEQIRSMAKSTLRLLKEKDETIKELTAKIAELEGRISHE
jgi:DNA topoisomerase VI subunit B